MSEEAVVRPTTVEQKTNEEDPQKTDEKTPGGAWSKVINFFDAFKPYAFPKDPSAISSLIMAVLLIYFLVNGEIAWAWVFFTFWFILNAGAWFV
jgi:hypothetical protein